MTNRLCPDCGAPIRGRVDKKFCSDICRNTYNNRTNSHVNNYMRSINNGLRRNRRVLESCVSNKIRRTRWQYMAADGFNFSLLTHTYKTKRGKTWYYCYEFGYTFSGPDYVLIRATVNRDLTKLSNQLLQ